MNDIVDYVRLGYCDHNCAMCVFNTDEDKRWGPCDINAKKMYKKNPKRFFALMRRRKADFKLLQGKVE